MDSSITFNRRRRVISAKTAIAWAAGLFITGQLMMNIILDYGEPKLRDPEHGYRLESLQAHQARLPEKRVVLMLGSSRTICCFRPSPGHSLKAEDRAPVLLYNFSHTSNGSVGNLLTFRRLLAEGIHPDWVFVEVFCLGLLEKANDLEDCWQHIHHVGMSDLPRLHRHYNPLQLYAQWANERMVPTYSYRFYLQYHFAPRWLPPEAVRANTFQGLDELGGADLLPAGEAGQRRAKRLGDLDELRRLFNEDFRVGEKPDRALRELLDLCRKEAIRVALVQTPDSSEMRDAYRPARAQIDTYLSAVADDYQVPLIDTRDWVDDKHFYDLQHTLPSGAEVFTRRFLADVLQPMLLVK